MTPEHILTTLFVSNFIGICCSRTLHYQFYSWYVSSLPLLLWSQRPSQSNKKQPYSCYPLIIRLILLGCCEYSFLIYPATSISSIILQIAHWLILLPHFSNLFRTTTTTSSTSTTTSGNLKED